MAYGLSKKYLAVIWVEIRNGVSQEISTRTALDVMKAREKDVDSSSYSNGLFKRTCHTYVKLLEKAQIELINSLLGEKRSEKEFFISDFSIYSTSSENVVVVNDKGIFILEYSTDCNADRDLLCGGYTEIFDITDGLDGYIRHGDIFVMCFSREFDSMSNRKYECFIKTMRVDYKDREKFTSLLDSFINKECNSFSVSEIARIKKSKSKSDSQYILCLSQFVFENRWNSFYQDNPLIRKHQKISSGWWLSYDDDNIYFSKSWPNKKSNKEIVNDIYWNKELNKWQNKIHEFLKSPNKPLVDRIPISSIIYYRTEGDVSVNSVVSSSKQSTNVGGAIVGGAVFGPAGAIIGSKYNTGTTYNTKLEKTDKRKIELRYYNENGNETVKKLPFYFHYMLSQVAPEKQYERVLQQNAIESNPNNTAANLDSAANEIRALKGLLDDGIITEAEFNAKKKQLLGI